MYYSEIKNCDIANGTGVRVTLFVSGCTHHCKGCFNEMTWDFRYGKVYDESVTESIMKMLAPDYIEGLTLLGGEPMEYVNQVDLLPLVRRVKEELPQKNIWCYTGYTFEDDILNRYCARYEESRELLKYIDILVDGEFILAQKDISLRFRGSRNQRIINVQESLKLNRTILWED